MHGHERLTSGRERGYDHVAIIGTQVVWYGSIELTVTLGDPGLIRAMELLVS